MAIPTAYRFFRLRFDTSTASSWWRFETMSIEESIRSSYWAGNGKSFDSLTSRYGLWYTHGLKFDRIGYRKDDTGPVIYDYEYQHWHVPYYKTGASFGRTVAPYNGIHDLFLEYEKPCRPRVFHGRIAGSTGTNITDIKLYGSEDGADGSWVLIGTLNGPFPNASIDREFTLGQYAHFKPIEGQYLTSPFQVYERAQEATHAFETNRIVVGRTMTHSFDAPSDQFFKPNLDNLKWFYSGGSTNDVHSLSLGGIQSTAGPTSQTFSPAQPISGFTVRSASNNVVGEGEVHLLVLSNGKRFIGWSPRNGVAPSYVEAIASGNYTYMDGRGTPFGYVTADIDLELLPTTSTYAPLWILNDPNQIFGDVGAAEARTGSVTYRCLYLHNDHPTEPIYQVGVSRKTDSHTRSTIRLGLDPAGVGGEATTIVDENTPPAGVTFSEPTRDSELSVGTLAAGESVAVWIERTIPPFYYESSEQDLSQIEYSARFGA